MRMNTISAALTAANSQAMEDLSDARMFAEGVGAAAFFARRPALPPVEFETSDVLRDGFVAGYEDARCGAACVQAGLA